MRRLGLCCAFAVPLLGCASAGGPQVRARFDCEDGQKLQVVFDHLKDAAVVDLGKGKSVALASKQPEAGMWYATDGYELRGAGDTLNYSAPDRRTTSCVQTR